MISFTSMASSNPLFDDIRSKADVDPPQIEESTDVGELVNDPAQTALKPNGTVSSSVRELLECPVCLSAMYPPIHQVVYVSMILLFLFFWVFEKACTCFNIKMPMSSKCNLLTRLGCEVKLTSSGFMGWCNCILRLDWRLKLSVRRVISTNLE